MCCRDSERDIERWHGCSFATLRQEVARLLDAARRVSRDHSDCSNDGGLTSVVGSAHASIIVGATLSDSSRVVADGDSSGDC